jgi:valyl-tRNA synthetase
VLAGEQPEGAVTEPLDRGMLQNLAGVVDEATAELENYEYAKALAKVEAFFWDFCDNYVEAAKSRRYGDFGPEAAASASTAMRLALSVLLRLLAPYLSFACEEVWSWTNSGSIHRAAWPVREELMRVSGSDEPARKAVLHLTDALNAIRKGKVDQKASIGTPVQQVVYQAGEEAIACLKLVERDLKAASRAETLVLQAGADMSVEITLKPVLPSAEASASAPATADKTGGKQ